MAMANMTIACDKGEQFLVVLIKKDRKILLTNRINFVTMAES